jgi:hypothetical protein
MIRVFSLIKPSCPNMYQDNREHVLSSLNLEHVQTYISMSQHKFLCPDISPRANRWSFMFQLFQISIDSSFWSSKHRNWKHFVRYKVVALWVIFPMPQSLSWSDVEIKRYFQFTSTMTILDNIHKHEFFMTSTTLRFRFNPNSMVKLPDAIKYKGTCLGHRMSKLKV